MKKWGYISKNVINCTPKDMAGEFAAGKLSMLIGPLSLASCIREENDSLKFQVCPIPSQIRPGCLILGDNIGLIRGSKEEARDFVRFLYTRESRLEIQKGMGTLPLWQEDEESVVLEEAHRELYEVFQEQGSVPSAYSSWFELSDVVSEYVYEVLIRTNVDLKSIAGMLQDEVRVAIMRN
jgi:ABC-type glycerol-3-phosphate transport system substrate-binding protein